MLGGAGLTLCVVRTNPSHGVHPNDTTQLARHGRSKRDLPGLDLTQQDGGSDMA